MIRLRRTKLKNLIKEAQARLAELPSEPDFYFNFAGPTEGFNLTCKNCGSTGPFIIKEDYSPETIGSSETTPDQTCLFLFCKKCSNHAYIWTDWRPNDINLK